MTIKVRLLYRDNGDHLSFRDASEYVPDPRDRDDTRRLLHELDVRLMQEHDAIAAALRAKIDGKAATLADFDKAVADRNAATARDTAERQAVIDAAMAQAHREAEVRAPLFAAAPDEIEFDHVPSEAELDKAFPNRKRLVLDDRALA